MVCEGWRLGRAERRRGAAFCVPIGPAPREQTRRRGTQAEYYSPLDRRPVSLFAVGRDGPIAPVAGELASLVKIRGARVWFADWFGELLDDEVRGYRRRDIVGMTYVELPKVNAIQGAATGPSNADEHGGLSVTVRLQERYHGTQPVTV